MQLKVPRGALLRIGVVTIVLSFFLQTLLFPEPFRSTTVIYPSSTHYADHLLSAGLRFGDEKESGEYIELLTSGNVLREMVLKNKLVEHYNLSNEKFPVERAVNQLKRNIEVERSPNRSLHITVSDDDAPMSANLSRHLVQAADDHLSKIIKDMVAKEYQVVRKIYQAKVSEVNRLRDSLSEMYNQGEPKVINGSVLESPGYATLRHILETETRNMLEQKVQFELLNSVLLKNVPPAYKISEAIAPEKGSILKKLVFSILVAIASCSFFLVLINRKAVGL